MEQFTEVQKKIIEESVKKTKNDIDWDIKTDQYSKEYEEKQIVKISECDEIIKKVGTV